MLRRSSIPCASHCMACNCTAVLGTQTLVAVNPQSWHWESTRTKINALLPVWTVLLPYHPSAAMLIHQWKTASSVLCLCAALVVNKTIPARACPCLHRHFSSSHSLSQSLPMLHCLGNAPSICLVIFQCSAMVSVTVVSSASLCACLSS